MYNYDFYGVPCGSKGDDISKGLMGDIILDSFKELNIYLNGYRDLLNLGNAIDEELNLFRLSYCAWFYLIENCMHLREHIWVSMKTVEIEQRYSIRSILA